MAKRFRFRLEVVRRLRKQKEDECRRVVAERLRQVSEVRSRISELTNRLHEEHAVMRNLAGTKAGDGRKPEAGTVSSAQALDVTDMRRHHAYVNYLHHAIAEADGRLSALQAELRDEQAQLAEASKQLKVIDKLKERQRARHELGLRRAELTEADEIAAQFARRVADRAAVGLAEGSQP